MEDRQRVFVRGVKGRGDEVLKMLENRGGENYYLDGADPEYLYFINHKGSISLALLDSEFGKIIMDNYTELSLPENWKDGDVLVDRHDSQIMVLYEFVSDKEADLFNAHIRLNGDMIILHSLEVRKRFRIATDQEIERFYEILHEHHKDWDDKKKKLVNWRWKPKNGETIYYFDEIGQILSDSYDDFSNGPLSDFGNCFHPREEAEAAAERVKKALKGE